MSTLRNFNIPMGQSSSSSSSSDDEPSQGYYDTDIVSAEQHLDKCKYTRTRTREPFGDRCVYILIRICKCGEFADKSYLLNGNMDFIECDGKELHTFDYCRWIRKKVKIKGQKKYVLCKYCSCKTTTQASTRTTSMNYPGQYQMGYAGGGH